MSEVLSLQDHCMSEGHMINFAYDSSTYVLTISECSRLYRIEKLALREFLYGLVKKELNNESYKIALGENVSMHTGKTYVKIQGKAISGMFAEQDRIRLIKFILEKTDEEESI